MRELSVLILIFIVAFLFAVSSFMIGNVFGLIKEQALNYDEDVYAQVDEKTSLYDNLFLWFFSGTGIILAITFFVVTFIKKKSAGYYNPPREKENDRFPPLFGVGGDKY